MIPFFILNALYMFYLKALPSSFSSIMQDALLQPKLKVSESKIYFAIQKLFIYWNLLGSILYRSFQSENYSWKSWTTVPLLIPHNFWYSSQQPHSWFGYRKPSYVLSLSHATVISREQEWELSQQVFRGKKNHSQKKEDQDKKIQKQCKTSSN